MPPHRRLLRQPQRTHDDERAQAERRRDEVTENEEQVAFINESQ